MAIRGDGTLWACGLNVGNQDKSASTAGTTTPVNPTAPTTATAGGSLGITSVGMVVNTLSRVTGVPTTTNWSDWTDVSAGRHFTIGIRADGTLWEWGFNTQMGIGSTTAVVTTFNEASGIIAVTNGGNSGVVQQGIRVITAPRQVGANNPAFQAGPFANDSAVGLNHRSASAGGAHSMYIMNRSLWVHGINAPDGRLGIGNTTTNLTGVNSITRIDNEVNWARISAGGATTSFGLPAAVSTGHTAAIKTDGSMWAWGLNTSGQLGNGTNTSASSPVRVGTHNDWLSVSAGADFTMAIKTDGTLWGWGANTNGKLGYGTSSAAYNEPVLIDTVGNQWAMVSAGFHHTVAIKADGSLWAWGLNASNRLGWTDPTPLSVPSTLLPDGLVGIVGLVPAPPFLPHTTMITAATGGQSLVPIQIGAAKNIHVGILEKFPNGTEWCNRCHVECDGHAECFRDCCVACVQHRFCGVAPCACNSCVYGSLCGLACCENCNPYCGRPCCVVCDPCLLMSCTCQVCVSEDCDGVDCNSCTNCFGNFTACGRGCCGLCNTATCVFNDNCDCPICDDITCTNEHCARCSDPCVDCNSTSFNVRASIINTDILEFPTDDHYSVIIEWGAMIFMFDSSSESVGWLVNDAVNNCNHKCDLNCIGQCSHICPSDATCGGAAQWFLEPSPQGLDTSGNKLPDYIANNQVRITNTSRSNFIDIVYSYNETLHAQTFGTTLVRGRFYPCADTALDGARKNNDGNGGDTLLDLSGNRRNAVRPIIYCASTNTGAYAGQNVTDVFFAFHGAPLLTERSLDVVGSITITILAAGW
jgi:hypothetical protein